MIPENDQFLTVGCNVQEHPDGLHFRLNFIDAAGKSRAVTLTRDTLPLLAAALHSKIGDGKIVPIDQKSLRAGANILVKGWDIVKRPDLGARLTLYVEMLDQDRVVTIPVDLSPENVTSLIIQLSQSPKQT
jgi:hypothetical protein